MPTDASRSRYSGILVPNANAEVWAAESSYTQAGPRPGVPEPTNVTDAVLATSGTMSANSSYTILTSDGGFPGTPVTSGKFVWKQTTDSATEYRGWNPPQSMFGWEAPLWTDGSGALKSIAAVDAVALTNGTVVAVGQVEDTTSAATRYRVEAQIRSSSGTWSRVTVYSTATSPSHAFVPCLVLLPSGRILCYFVIADSTYANVRMMYSDDSGATWAFGGDGVLDRDFIYATETVQRMRGAYSNGQILLVIETRLVAAVSARNRLQHFASTDKGNSYESVTQAWVAYTTTSTGHPVVLVGPDGVFILLYLTTNDTAVSSVECARLANAFVPLGAAPKSMPSDDYSGFPTTHVVASDAIQGEFTATIDEHGALYVYAFNWSNKRGTMTYSPDGGQSWEAFGRSILGGSDYGLWWNGDGSADYPARIHALAWRGCVLMLHGWVASTGNEDDSLGVMYLGGYSTVTMPTIPRTPSETARSGWEKNWIPIEIPSDMNWTASGTGTVTLGASTARLEVSTLAAQVQYYYDVPAGTVAEGLIARFRVEVPAGNGDYTTNRISALFRLDGGGVGYDVEIRFQDTGFKVYDAVAGTLIGTVTTTVSSPGVEIIIGLNEGSVSTWYRSYSSTPAKRWTVGPTSTTLVDSGGATGANRIEFGHRVTAASAAASYWYEMHYVTNDNVGQGLADGQTNPDDLYGRNFSSRPVYVDDGFSIAMTDGPTFVGDTWTVAARYDYALTNALNVPSPRKTWRSTTTGAQTIALRWDDSIGDDAWPDRQLLGIALLNTNISRFSLDFYSEADATWYTFATVNLYEGMGNGLKFTRDGHTVRPNTSSASTQLPYFKHNELAGATFSYSTTAGRRIARNAEGGWQVSSSVRTRPVVTLVDADSGDASSGSAGAIIPKNAVVLIDLMEYPYKAVRLVVPAVMGGSTHPAPAESYYEIGTLVFGSVYVWGKDYDWGRVIDTEAGVEIAESRDRTRRSRVAAPPRRTVEIAWMDGADLTDVSADEADPAYVIPSTDAKAEPNASRHGTPTVLEGLVHQLNGPHTPIVYLPLIAKDDSARVLNRREEMIYGRIESPMRIESVVGTELTSEFVRVATVTLVEEV